MKKYRIKKTKNKIKLKINNKKHYEINHSEDEYIAKGFIDNLIDHQIVLIGKQYSIEINKDSLITIEQYIKKHTDYLMLNELLYKIAEIIEKMQTVGLNSQKLILNPKGVFINEKSSQIKMFYVPLNEYESNDNYVNLLLYIIDHAKVTGLSGFKNFLQHNNSITQIEEFLIDLRVGYMNHMQAQNGKVCPRCQKINVSTARYCIYCGSYLKKKILDIEEELEEETSLLGEDNEEHITQRIIKHFVRREITGEVRIINKPQYHLGKEITNEFVINNNIVSRNHATIVLNHDQCYLIDNCSTNYTYVNNKRVLPNEQRRLQSGDLFKLGNEEFTYFEKLE